MGNSKGHEEPGINDSLEHISEGATTSSPAKIIEPGAVLIVVRGMILTRDVPVAVLRVPAAINQDLKALIPGGDLLPEYLSLDLWARQLDLLDLVERSTHDTRKLQTESLLKLLIRVPSPADQALLVSKSTQLVNRMMTANDLGIEARRSLEAFKTAVLRTETFGGAT